MVGIGFGTSVQHLTSAVTARRFRAELHAPRKHPEIKKKKKKPLKTKKNVTVSQQLPLWLYNSKPRQLNCLTKMKNNKKTIFFKRDKSPVEKLG